MAAKVKAQQIIDDNGVVVFSKSYCPYCKATKALLKSKNAKYFVMELDEIDGGTEIQEALKEIAEEQLEKTLPRMSVPSIWFGGKYLGGNDTLHEQGRQLDGMLKSAGAIEA